MNDAMWPSRTPQPNDWTPEQIATLRSMAGTVPTDEIAHSLGRTRSAVQRKAQRLGIGLRVRTPATRASGTWWTEDDIGHLRRMARTHTVAETAAALGRGYHATVRKAGLLHIAFRKQGELHNSATHPTTTLQSIWALRKAGLGPYRISRRLALPPAYVSGIIYYRSRWHDSLRMEAAE